MGTQLYSVHYEYPPAPRNNMVRGYSRKRAAAWRFEDFVYLAIKADAALDTLRGRRVYEEGQRIKASFLRGETRDAHVAIGGTTVRLASLAA